MATMRRLGTDSLAGEMGGLRSRHRFPAAGEVHFSSDVC